MQINQQQTYYLRPVVIRHTIKASTVIKVVIVGAAASYFGRNLVAIIDRSLAKATEKMEEKAPES